MNEGYELYTVRQAAAMLCTSEVGLRARVKSGKLEAIKEGGRLLLTLEAVQRHAASLPHPVQVMASMQYARMTMGLGQQMAKMWYPPQGMATWLRVLWPELAPLCRALLDAVKAKNYAEVERLDWEITKLNTDYEMGCQPIFPRYTPPQARAVVPGEQAALFPTGRKTNP